MGRGIWRGDFGSNRGYFIKMGVEIFLSLGLQLGLFYKNGGRNIFEFGAAIGVIL